MCPVLDSEGKFVVETGKAFVFLTEANIFNVVPLSFSYLPPPSGGGALKTDMIFGAAISN